MKFISQKDWLCKPKDYFIIVFFLIGAYFYYRFQYPIMISDPFESIKERYIQRA